MLLNVRAHPCSENRRKGINISGGQKASPSISQPQTSSPDGKDLLECVGSLGSIRFGVWYWGHLILYKTKWAMEILTSELVYRLIMNWNHHIWLMAKRPCSPQNSGWHPHLWYTAIGGSRGAGAEFDDAKRRGAVGRCAECGGCARGHCAGAGCTAGRVEGEHPSDLVQIWVQLPVTSIGRWFHQEKWDLDLFISGSHMGGISHHTCLDISMWGLFN